MKKLALILSLSVLFFSSCEQIENVIQNPGLTNEEVIQGLKAALNVGTDTSVSVLSKVDGYYKDELVKIALPAEAANIYNVIGQIPGGSKLLEDAVLAVNRAAEDAAPEAKSIFVNAITGISIADGFSILNGGDTAATVYLHEKTYNPLTETFSPKIRNSLAKPLVFGVSAEKAYNDLIDAYNLASLGGILWPRITTNSLSVHVTQKALDGLFFKVSEEERKIRKDPLHRVSEILKKVFGSKG
ncbi:MAG: DUF4197 domain-containing protein [Bacteroidia bacterium]